MKKLFTFALALMVVVGSYAQVQKVSSKDAKMKVAQEITLSGEELYQNVGSLPNMTRTDAELDFTTYDWQTNAGYITRTITWPDGIANFASKVGAGIASGLTGLVMGLAGYDGLAEVQTASANNAIVFLYNYMPLILFCVMLVLSLMYKVDSIRPQMNADLAARHGEIKAE